MYKTLMVLTISWHLPVTENEGFNAAHIRQMTHPTKTVKTPRFSNLKFGMAIESLISSQISFSSSKHRAIRNVFHMAVIGMLCLGESVPYVWKLIPLVIRISPFSIL
jgi:hypothetical protein